MRNLEMKADIRVLSLLKKLHWLMVYAFVKISIDEYCQRSAQWHHHRRDRMAAVGHSDHRVCSVFGAQTRISSRSSAGQGRAGALQVDLGQARVVVSIYECDAFLVLSYLPFILPTYLSFVQYVRYRGRCISATVPLHPLQGDLCRIHTPTRMEMSPLDLSFCLEPQFSCLLQ